ncbi:hypothetical protein KCTCHS21_17920 [Cohnella abietis]|uniref:Uncharacterized protein n=1 Tax=Cohnella abietis TaxID=2507935 RepID=A0A3T1D2Q8_9BACL|nr:hypothetical protein KCTCHS21_17920 [Cohnella abietis]
MVCRKNGLFDVPQEGDEHKENNYLGYLMGGEEWMELIVRSTTAEGFMGGLQLLGHGFVKTPVCEASCRRPAYNMRNS